MELGTIAEGNEVELTADEAGEKMNVSVYRFSERAMIELYEKLNQMPMHLTSWSDTRLAGGVNVTKAGMLLTTIPFDAGWTVEVDGEPAETKKALEAFLAVDLPEGYHEITFSYLPEGIREGSLITILSLLMLILLYVGKQCRDKKRMERTIRGIRERYAREEKRENAQPTVREAEEEKTLPDTAGEGGLSQQPK